MGKGIVNLTRSVLPKISANPAKNIEAINSMPEMLLARMRREGAKNILHCDMNQCVAGIISPNNINTIYTDGLNGCNAVNIITKLKDGRFVSIMSHYVPTNLDGQIKAIESQLKTYSPYFDSAFSGRGFLNIRGREQVGKLELEPNPIIDKLKVLMTKYFPRGSKIDVTPYQNSNRPPFFSSANIFQFNPQNLSELKITNVGEKERFIDLMG